MPRFSDTQKLAITEDTQKLANIFFKLQNNNKLQSFLRYTQEIQISDFARPNKD